jgi:hypothetical protein
MPRWHRSLSVLSVFDHMPCSSPLHLHLNSPARYYYERQRFVVVRFPAPLIFAIRDPPPTPCPFFHHPFDIQGRRTMPRWHRSLSVHSVFDRMPCSSLLHLPKKLTVTLLLRTTTFRCRSLPCSTLLCNPRLTTNPLPLPPSSLIRSTSKDDERCLDGIVCCPFLLFSTVTLAPTPCISSPAR